MRFETKAVRLGEEPEFSGQKSSDVVRPIHLSSTFARKKMDSTTEGFEYSRQGNPSRNGLEEKLAALENAKFGLAFSSGLAAETAIIMSLLKSGDHVVAFNDLYGGSRRLFTKVFQENFKIEFSFVDARSLDDVAAALRENTRMIWLETPTNPLMRLCDISAISSMAHEKNILVAVDNTFASPYFQQPLDLGADIVMHSTTKYLNGHSDSIGGCVMLNDEELNAKLKFNQNAIGAILSPFDSFLVSRGIKTLALRMERHNSNGLAIAHYLEDHSKVKAVHYPGLKSHSQFELARQQMSGYGGMISFELDRGGNREATAFLEKLTCFSIAESLGGVESLAELPAVMTHASVPAEERKMLGISDSFIRLSAGIEHVDDLVEDIEDALKII